MNKIDVVYEITAKIDKFETGISKVQQEFQKTNATIEKGEAKISSFFKNIAKAGITALGVVSVFEMIRKSIEEAVESARNILRLEASIKNLGFSAEESKEILQDFIKEAKKLSEITGVDDDVIIRLYQLGTQAGLSIEQTKEITKLALNLSEAFGLDLQTAMLQTIRLFQGGETYLTRYDARLKALIQSGASNAKIAEYMTSTYGGFLEKVKDVNVIQKFQTVIQNLFEELGTIFLPQFIKTFESFSEVIKKSAGALNFLGSILEIVFNALSLILGVVRKIADFFNPVLNFINKLVKGVNNLVVEVGKLVGVVGKTQEETVKTLENQLKLAKKEIEHWAGSLEQTDIAIRKKITIPIEFLTRAGDEELKRFFKEIEASFGVDHSFVVELKKAVIEYRRIQGELTLAQKAQTKALETNVKVNKETLGTIRKVSDETEKSLKTEKSIHDTIISQLLFIEKIANLKKIIGASDEEIKKFLKEQLDALGEQVITIENQQVKVKDISSFVIENTEKLGENRDKLISIAEQWQNISNRVSVVNEKQKESVDTIDEILPLFEDLAKGISEIEKRLEDLPKIVNLITQAIRAINTGNIVNVMNVVIQGLVMLANVVSVYFRDVEQVNIEWEKTSRIIDDITEMIEVLSRYSENLPKAGEEYRKILEEQRKLLIEQFKIIAKQLGLSEDFRKVNIEQVKQTLQTLQTQRSMFERWKGIIEREVKPLASTFLGVNVISSEAWSKFQGIVNELEKMGVISKKVADSWRDNFNITADIESMISILNSSLDETGKRIENITKYMEIAQKLRGEDLDFQIQSNEYLLKIYENEERISELRGEGTEQIRKKQIEVLSNLKKAYERQGDILKVQSIEIQILEKQKEIQEAINEEMDKRVSKVKELIDLGIIDVENIADLQKLISELQEMGISGIGIYTKLGELGVRAGGLTNYISQNWNVNLNYSSRDLFESFVNRTIGGV